MLLYGNLDVTLAHSGKCATAAIPMVLWYLYKFHPDELWALAM
jgi:hypothetical protein